MDKFSRTLMDHVASDAKTPLQKVEAAFHEWRAKMEEQDAVENYLYDKYAQNIERPRAERAQLYEEYCNAKARLRETWRLAPDGDKARAFREWINLQVPPEVAEVGIDNERVYTKNVTTI